MIDWSKAPNGAQRYHNVWGWLLERDGDIKGRFSDSMWNTYVDQGLARIKWGEAVTRPVVSKPSDTPPLQLTWDGAEPEATHILQNSDTSKQVFAVRSKGSFVTLVRC